MELANVAFHIENTSKRNILGRRWRKCNIKEKLDNLQNVNPEKRVILWKFFNDELIHKGNSTLHSVHEESGGSTGDCESMSCESNSLNDYESRTTLNQAYLFDDGYSCDSFSSSGSSSALSDWQRPGLTREAGDGMETPKIPRCKSNWGARKRLQLQTSVTTTDKSCHVNADRRSEYSARDLEYSCTLSLFSEPEEPSTSSARGRGVTCPKITKRECTQLDHECVSSTKMTNKDCFKVESSLRKQCNGVCLTKAPLKHKAKSKLKQLLKLYKARKLNKKHRSREHGNSNVGGNALNIDGCKSWGNRILASTSGPSQNAIHEDICLTVELNNRWRASDGNTVHQVFEPTEKNDVVSNRLAEFYDYDGLDLAKECYCSENDEFAYLNNGFVLD